jgi:hypothetical protein
MWNNPQDFAILLDRNGNPASADPPEVLRSISGQVFKTRTTRGIADATVTARLVDNPNTQGTSAPTDAHGCYLIEGLIPAKYTVTASKEGEFITSDGIPVDVTTGDSTQDFYLTPSSTVINISVVSTEVMPAQPEQNRTHQLKVTFRNNTEDVYHFETTLYRRLSSTDGWSEVPNARQPFDETISENQTKEVTFTVPKEGWMDWTWFTTNALGYASEIEISRKILYEIWFKAIRQENNPAFEDTKELEVTVKVSAEKRVALVEYNFYLGVAEASAASAMILSAAAATALLGLITAPLAAGLLIAAAAATYSSYEAKRIADEKYKIMER